jgi:hypothetical protein
MYWLKREEQLKIKMADDADWHSTPILGSQWQKKSGRVSLIDSLLGPLIGLATGAEVPQMRGSAAVPHPPPSPHEGLTSADECGTVISVFEVR